MEGVKERTERYIRITRRALQEVEIVPPEGTELRRIAEKLLDTARRYLLDAEYYYSKGEYATALSSVSYAHAWIDAGVVIGVLKGEDPKIFMV